MEAEKAEIVVLDGGAYWHLKEERWHWDEEPLYTLLLKLNSDPVACLRIFKRTLHRDEAAVLAWGIGGVYTRPDHRGEGWATKLLEEAISLAQKRRLSSLILHSADRTLYTRLGFQEMQPGLYGLALQRFDLQKSGWEIKPEGHF